MSTNTPSRRRVLGGMAATAATVVGWNVATQTWATAAEAGRGHGGGGVSPVPALDGTLKTSAADLVQFSKDFGNLVSDITPWAVLVPGSVNDIVKMVNFARSNKLKIAANGRSGTGDDLESHSNYGQAAVPGGISIDSRGLSKIVSIGANTAVVEAGVTWHQLTEAALAKGKMPPAMPDYMHLSIGGTISVGGIGGTVGTYGLAVDTIESIDIVTGAGQLLTASPAVRPDLFNAALAGGGQVGIIVRATVRIVPPKERVVVFNLVYNDVATYLADAEKVLAEGRFEVQAGELQRKPDDSGWRYKMELGATYTGTAPAREPLIAGLRDVRSEAVIDDMAFLDYVYRFDAYVEYYKEADYWDQPKPWLSLFLPASKVKQFLQIAEADLTANDLGVGFVLTYPYRTSKLRRPMAVQPNDSVGYLFDLLRFPHPGEPDIAGMLEQNRRLYDKAVALGAKRYLVGAIPRMTPADWKRHFGNRYSDLCNAKRRYDPADILTPGQGFFA
ncbi:putative oxidoreductase [Streptomyces sp. L-9-10]|uniref:FAD-binding protein n=1 Tax=Streptomyces sp. L-9-10 TaxID=1478131 RepID=UPI00101BDE23|nr:FAD-binding protein [Streptomyces sp. L-9-10]RYJ31677.1 putative oxidoreductase [Streptomyces sp. L-9-10]